MDSEKIQALKLSKAEEIIGNIRERIEQEMPPLDFMQWLGQCMYEAARDIAHATRIEQEETKADMENLSHEDRAEAYRATADRFNLRAKQRDALDVSNLYPAIMRAAHAEDWTTVEKLLLDGGITRPNGNVNTCTCTHCEPFLDAQHGNGCSGYHCSGSCMS